MFATSYQEFLIFYCQLGFTPILPDEVKPFLVTYELVRQVHPFRPHQLILPSRVYKDCDTPQGASTHRLLEVSYEPLCYGLPGLSLADLEQNLSYRDSLIKGREDHYLLCPRYFLTHIGFVM